MATITKDNGAVFLNVGGSVIGIPKGMFVFAHPQLASTHVVISDKPYFDGRSGIVVAQADVTEPTSANVNELITKLHRDFFPNAVGAYASTAETIKSGYWQYPQMVHNLAANSTYTLGADTLHAFPILIEADIEFDNLGIKCLGGGTGTFFSFALYKPGNKNTTGDYYVSHEILTIDGEECRFQAANANATYAFSFGSRKILKAGVYFAAFNANGTVNIRGVNNNSRLLFGAGLTAMGDNPINRFQSNAGAVLYSTELGLPDICPVLTNKSFNGVQPLIGIQYVN